MQYEESELCFQFSPEHWSFLMQYDTSKDFLKIRDAIHGTKAVDFIGVFQNNVLSIIEVKNFRGSRIETKARTEKGEDPLEIEIAHKVKDSISGIIGANRNATHNTEEWQKYVEFLINSKSRIEVVLWLEEDFDPRPKTIQQKRFKANGGTLNQRLKNKLRWLTPHVIITNLEENPYMDGLNVQYLNNNKTN